MSPPRKRGSSVRSRQQATERLDPRFRGDDRARGGCRRKEAPVGPAARSRRQVGDHRVEQRRAGGGDADAALVRLLDEAFGDQVVDLAAAQRAAA